MHLQIYITSLKPFNDSTRFSMNFILQLTLDNISMTLNQCLLYFDNMLNFYKAILQFDIKSFKFLHFIEMNKLFALLWNLSWSVILVASLYVWRLIPFRIGLDTSKKRMISMLITAILFAALTPATFEQMGFTFSIITNVYGIVLPTFMTMTLFLGPLVQLYYDEGQWMPEVDWETVKTIIFAPFFEELMFRSSFMAVMLNAGFTQAQTIWITPLFFGIGMLRFFNRNAFTCSYRS